LNLQSSDLWRTLKSTDPVFEAQDQLGAPAAGALFFPCSSTDENIHDDPSILLLLFSSEGIVRRCVKSMDNAPVI
jgi:hypothetical protein